MSPLKNNKTKILFLMTGSIACYKACYLISKMVQKGWDVQVVATPQAMHFIGRSTLEGLSGHGLYIDPWTPGESMKHIELIRWADVVILAPATANTINKMAAGIADNLVTNLFLAFDFKIPFIIAPAMNSLMYTHPITQRSLQTLNQMGVQILETESGSLACGETGWGRLLDPDRIIESVFQTLQHYCHDKKEELKGNTTSVRKKRSEKRILVTSGGTVEPLDDVRVLANLSTGRTGASISDALMEAGYSVVYLHGKNAEVPSWRCERIEFTNFENLKKELLQLLKERIFDVCVHAAAVSDFSIPYFGQKISSDKDFTLTLRKNPKLVNYIKEWSQNSNIHLIAFKLTVGLPEAQKIEKLNKLFDESNADLIVHNDINNILKDVHLFHVFKSGTNAVSFEADNSKILGDYFVRHFDNYFFGG